MPFSRIRNSVAKFSSAYVTNCVAPVASDTASSTGWLKNMRHVGQNGALAEGLGGSCPAVVSSPPRTGSLTQIATINAATTPTTPIQINAERQSYAAAIDAPNATPSANPI